MFEFGLNEKEIKEIIEPKLKLYRIDNNHLKDIDELIRIKVENGSNIEENQKYEKSIKEITELYNKEINEELKEKELIENKSEVSTDNSEEKNSNKNNKCNKNSTNYNKKNTTKINKNKKQSIWELDE